MKAFETFREFGTCEINNMKQDYPSCFNGIVRVVKYRITIEQIDELDTVIKGRIKRLYETTNNMHHRPPLQKIAKKYGLKL